MDLILRNAIKAEGPGRPVDIGIADGRIAAIAPALAADGESLDLGGRLVVPGLVETHLHLDKSCIMDRVAVREGTLAEAVAQVAAAKRGFTAADVAERAGRTLRKCIVNGTMRIRTHVEVDPVIGLTGFAGVKAAAADHGWAVDVEICVFPQEGLLNNPGTEALMRAALSDGARVVGAAPYTDSDPHGQIDRVFAIARDFDADIDMHLDLSADAASLDADHVCRQADAHGWGGRVAIGHVTKLAFLEPERFAATARRLADAGVAVTVLPSTDLFLIGRERDHAIPRGVAPAHRLLAHGVNCSLSTNNVLNAFTPFGDASLIRMANLFANVAQLGTPAEMAECLAMVSARSARLMNLGDYGVAVGAPADIVVLDASDPATAVAELAQPLCGYKAGRRTFTRPIPQLHPPG
ncbi:MAG: amidohydrolase family protein [Alphaproteobacteria bacterium]